MDPMFLVLSQVIKAGPIGSVVVTDIVPTSDGLYTREWRFFGPVPQGGGPAPLVFTFVGMAEDAQALRMNVPAHEM